MPAKYGEFKLDKTDKQDKSRSSRGTARRIGSAATAWKGALTEGTIEEDLPLERYKEGVLAEISPTWTGVARSSWPSTTTTCACRRSQTR